MASEAPFQGGLCRDDAYAWSKQTVLRIEALTEQQVLSELQEVMGGRNYSWHSINELLQNRLDQGDLEFTLVDGDVLFEWNNLCDEKRGWERKGRLSHNCAEFNRGCLINLMILPFQGGLGLENLPLVTANVDKPNLSTMDLWVAHETRELEDFTDEDSEDTDSDESLSWVVEDSEDSDEDVNYECAGHDEFRDSDIEDKDWEGRYIEEGYAEDDVNEDVEEDAEDFDEDVDEGFDEYFENVEEDVEEDVESEED